MSAPVPDLKKIDDIDMLVVNDGGISFQCPARFGASSRERQFYDLMLGNLEQWKKTFAEDGGVTIIRVEDSPDLDRIIVVAWGSKPIRHEFRTGQMPDIEKIYRSIYSQLLEAHGVENNSGIV